VKKDNHYGEYSFGTCLPRPSLIPPPLPLSLPVETTTSNRFFFIVILFLSLHFGFSYSCTRPSPLRVVQSNSPVPNEPTNPSITNFNGKKPDLLISFRYKILISF